MSVEEGAPAEPRAPLSTEDSKDGANDGVPASEGGGGLEIRVSASVGETRSVLEKKVGEPEEVETARATPSPEAWCPVCSGTQVFEEVDIPEDALVKRRMKCPECGWVGGWRVEP
jgi:hypothetical protein